MDSEMKDKKLADMIEEITAYWFLGMTIGLIIGCLILLIRWIVGDL